MGWKIECIKEKKELEVMELAKRISWLRSELVNETIMIEIKKPNDIRKWLGEEIIILMGASMPILYNV